MVVVEVVLEPTAEVEELALGERRISSKEDRNNFRYDLERQRMQPETAFAKQTGTVKSAKTTNKKQASVAASTCKPVTFPQPTQ